MYNTQGDFRCYQTILHGQRPRSHTHPPMSRLKRAAQFAPFDALTGYGAAIREMARQTEPRQELTDDEKHILNQHLLRLQTGTVVSASYFLPDERKDGGAYRTVTGTVKKLDGDMLYLTDRTSIPLEFLYQLELHGTEFFPDCCATEDFPV